MRESVGAGPGLAAVLLAGDAQSAQDIPGVLIVGAILGALLLVAAIRGMFGGKKK